MLMQSHLIIWVKVIFDLISWADSSQLEKWEYTIEIKEQTLMNKLDTPRILNIGSDSWHTGDDTIYAENAFVIKNCELNNFWSTTKESPIPCTHKNEKKYIATFVTQIIKGDKFLIKK